MDIVKFIKKTSDSICGNGVSKENIKQIEDALNLKLAKEYKDYLIEFGIAAVNGHELTGISASNRTNVIKVTQEEKSKNPNIPDDYYVVEQLNIDNIVVWQTHSGKIFQSTSNDEITKIANSLVEYIEL